MSVTPLPRTIEWIGGLDGVVRLIDQTRLPGELQMLDLRDVEEVWEAVKSLRVRGAPAIGIAAAMGAVLGIRDHNDDDPAALLRKLSEVCDYLASSRPTAVNLTWALDRLKRVAQTMRTDEPSVIKTTLLEEARRIRDEDARMCREIGKQGQHLIRENSGILTHCNAGSLATAEFGTALAPLYAAHEMGRSFHVFADETRPLLQGARLTAWELMQAGIRVTVLCDSMAAVLMREGKIDLVITGADRIAANGDVANKIGTYGLAVLANAHDIPFYVAAPSSTFDLAITDGRAIPIEYRDEDEIRCGFGRQTAPAGVPCYAPAFDVTPASLVRGLITELGVIEPVCTVGIKESLVDSPSCLDSSDRR